MRVERAGGGRGGGEGGAGEGEIVTNIFFLEGWRKLYDLTLELRKERDAPVDWAGSESLGKDPITGEIDKYHALISLMLSSQTKDQVVAEAMGKLRARALVEELRVPAVDATVAARVLVGELGAAQLAARRRQLAEGRLHGHLRSFRDRRCRRRRRRGLRTRTRLFRARCSEPEERQDSENEHAELHASRV